MSELKKLADDIIHLKAACAASHKSAIGGSTICICGRGNGGSAACNALRNLAAVLRNAEVPPCYEDDLFVWRELLGA